MIIKVLHANPEDVIELLVSEGYSEDDGKIRAEEWIEKRKPKEQSHKDIHPDILSVITRMSEYELGRWVSLGERIIEERSKTR